MPQGDGRELRKQLQIACATVHGVGVGMSGNDLIELVLDKGLPPREERERILAEKLAGDDTTPFSSPD